MKDKFEAKNRKKNRIVIKNMEEALELIGNKDIVLSGGVKIKELLEEYFVKKNIKFKVDDLDDFIDYIEKMHIYAYYENKLYERFDKVEKLIIERVEFDRNQSENKCLNYERSIEIERIAEYFHKDIKEEEKKLIEEVEESLKEDYVYSKDIELLKKILCSNNEDVSKVYDEEKNLRTIGIVIKKSSDYKYIKAEAGSVEYHKFLNSNIDRIKRLLKNMDKYLIKKSENIYALNQSAALQDSINIALAFYNNKEFKAISGKNDIIDFCKAPVENKCAFESYKVNKLGQIGYGYKRVNDSEKKILEEIHKEISNKILEDGGKLTLITKWQPCPSCYLVLKQFSNFHKNIEIEVKYIKRYGEV